MNEIDIIQYFISQQQYESVAFGIGDDAAVLNISPDCQLITTTDTMVEGRHFVKQVPAYAIAYKLMASNLSDIAAMGAKPKWATLNLTVTKFDQAWIEDFAKGLFDCAQQHQVAVVGGDTTRGEQLNVSLNLIGELPISTATMRNQAELDDLIFVTGKVGVAAAALKYFQQNEFQYSALNDQQIRALYKPASRIELAISLRQYIHASIDISDGLLHELELICESSKVGANIRVEKIPVHDHVDVMAAITSGDDYELLFTADAKYKETIFQLARQNNCEVTVVGNITQSTDIKLLLDSQHIPYPNYSGYDHFNCQSK